MSLIRESEILIGRYSQNGQRIYTHPVERRKTKQESKRHTTTCCFALQIVQTALNLKKDRMEEKGGEKDRNPMETAVLFIWVRSFLFFSSPGFLTPHSSFQRPHRRFN